LKSTQQLLEDLCDGGVRGIVSWWGCLVGMIHLGNMKMRAG